MGRQESESVLIEDDDANFSDALEEFPFYDASNSFQFQHSLPVSSSSSVSDLHDYKDDAISKQPKLAPESQSLHRRRHSSKEHPRSCFKNSLVGFDLHGSTISLGRNYKLLWNSKDNGKLNRSRVGVNSNKDTNGVSLSSSVITSDVGVNDSSVTVDSSNPGTNFLFTIAELVIKAVAFQTSLLVGFVTLPIWLMYSSYMFLVDPFAIVRRGRSYMKRSISRFLSFIKWIVYTWVKRNRSTWKFCLQIGWGFLWSAVVGIILVGLLVMGFVISAAIMKCILDVPIQKIEKLNFDYTRDTPMAFVPIISCPETLCLECNEKFKSGNAARSRVIPLDHKLQATVSLIMPESDYNRNLGIFQVRVDFLSSNGKPLLSTMQPCMLQFKSKPIRLLLTVFKLAPLITGYSSESQTLNIKFSGHTETQVPTSCLRVVMEPRAQFANGGGVPEIYTAYLKLDSQLPLLKRILWSWKATVFVWMSMVMFTVVLFFTMLCCMPIIAPWLCPRDNRNAYRNSQSS